MGLLDTSAAALSRLTLARGPVVERSSFLIEEVTGANAEVVFQLGRGGVD